MTKVMKNQSGSLAGKIRPDRMAMFMRKAYGELSFDYEKLDGLLQDECWPEASKLAHKLKSVVVLVDLNGLLPPLRTIEAIELAEISSSDFQSNFRNQYRESLQQFRQSIGE